MFKKGDVLLNTVPEKICMSGLISRFERQVVTCADVCDDVCSYSEQLGVLFVWFGAFAVDGYGLNGCWTMRHMDENRQRTCQR